ncbi:MAG: hypothetical protein ABIU38_19775 [Vicinamibacteraceae bacterium]
MTWVRPLTCAAALLGLVGATIHASQAPVPHATTASPPRDPVTVRGCLEKHWLRIIQSDATDLSGIRRVRLKGSKAMLRMLDDGHGRYVEITGDLDVGARDRLETRRKYTVDPKTTVSLGASAEQRGETVAVAPDPTLIVDAFERLGDQCPAR